MKELPKEEQTKKITDLFRPKSGLREASQETSLKSASEADYSPLKTSAVIIVGAGCAFIFGYALSVWPMPRSFAVGLIFASLFALMPLMLKAKSLHFAAAFISSVALVLPLYVFGHIPLIPIAVLVTLSVFILTAGVLYGKRELDNSLRISFMKFSGKVLMKTFTVIALAGAIAYGWNFKTEDIFSGKFIDGVISLSSPIVNYYAPGFTPEMKFSDLLEISARRIVTGEKSAEFALMPEALKKQLISQAIQDAQKTVESTFGVRVNLDASFRENVRTVITEKLKGPLEVIPDKYVAIAAMVIVFAFLRGALWLLGWLAAAISFLVYQLLLAVKFAKVYLEPKSKEVILLR
jgi:hypothetical protein